MNWIFIQPYRIALFFFYLTEKEWKSLSFFAFLFPIECKDKSNKGLGFLAYKYPNFDA